MGLEMQELINFLFKFFILLFIFVEVAKQSGSFRDRNKENHAQKGNVARSFTFKELATATQNFREANLIGEGGFGCVYKGRLESGIVSSQLSTQR